MEGRNKGMTTEETKENTKSRKEFRERGKEGRKKRSNSKGERQEVVRQAMMERSLINCSPARLHYGSSYIKKESNIKV